MTDSVSTHSDDRSEFTTSALYVVGTPIERTWYVVHMTSKRLLPAGQRFRQFLMEHTAPSLLRDYREYTHHDTAGAQGHL